MKKVVLLFISLFVFASIALGAEQYQKWHVLQTSNGDGVAATFGKDTDISLVFRCFAKDKQCLHLIRPKIKCDDGGEYPMLVNSDSGAYLLTAICGHSKGVPELYLKEYDKVHNMLKNGSYIGFAIPMESGSFKAVRFSLMGSSKAMGKAEAYVASGKLQRSSKSSGASYF